MVPVSQKRMLDQKREHGQYFTTSNPFKTAAFRQWAEKIPLSQARILEPFAGSNNLIHCLQDLGLCNAFQAYDLHPKHPEVQQRDTLQSFPRNHPVCVTNPPWLARNSASKRGLPFPSTIVYDNLYKHCLSLCLEHCKHVAALIPASFLQSNLFQNRLEVYMLLHNRHVFHDTDHPVCLALFGEKTPDTQIYYDNQFIGLLRNLKRHLPKVRRQRTLKFNDPHGALGFISFDSIHAPSIRFCEAKEIAHRPIKMSSRFFTRIGGDIEDLGGLIGRLNQALAQFRASTDDVFLTPFKGLRRDGKYRRRMEFAMARDFICAYGWFRGFSNRG